MKCSSKALITFFFIGLSTFLISTAYAQTFFGTTPPASQPSPAPNPPPSKALTSEEFNKLADQVRQQNTNTLSKEVQQSAPKLSPPPPPPQMNQPINTQPIQAQPVQAQPTTPTAPVTTAPSQPTTPPPNYSSSSSDVGAAAPPTNQPLAPANPAAPKAPPVNQPYTGFGTGNSGTNSNSGTTQENTGWRIQY